MKPVPNWRDCTRRHFYSIDQWRHYWSVYPMHAGLLFAAVKTGLVAASAATGWFAILSASWSWALVTLLFVAGFIARIYMQRPKPPRRRDPPDWEGA